MNVDPEQISPLLAAAAAGDLTTVKSLLEQGADKNEVAKFGRTAMIYAAMNSQLSVLSYLVEQGALMDKADTEHGYTPLFWAVIEGHLEVVRYLLEQGADRDHVAYYDDTPLHWAANDGHLEIAKLLMVYGADLNARDWQGQLPIDIATTEEVRQAIRDEPRRRMDEAPGKRATEQDRHPNAASSASSASAQQDGDEEEEVKQGNNHPLLDVVPEAEGLIADEDQDSEPSSDEDGNWVVSTS